MDYYASLFASKVSGGGGSGVTVEPLTVTENGTYQEEGKAYSPVNVNVPVGWTTEGIIDGTEPSGDIDVTFSPSITLSGTGLNGRPVTSFVIRGVTRLELTSGTFANMKNLRKAVLPDLESTAQNGHFASSFVSDGTGICILPKFNGGQYGEFGTNNNVGLLDFGSVTSRFMSLNRCLKLKKLILRATSVVALNGTSVFNNTPFMSGGAGGTIYIPKTLYDHLGDGTSLDYKSATNWATMEGYGTITWAQIEGSQYENTDWWVNY